MRADATLLLLDKDAVEQLLTPDEVTQAVREAFVLHGRREGRVFPVVTVARLIHERAGAQAVGTRIGWAW